MPRTARACVGDVCYHVINRGNGRNSVFHKVHDYSAFVDLLSEANALVGMRLLVYCLMPNHFHLLVWPKGDGDLSRYMHWLLTTHVRRNHQHYKTSGRVWQGRFKAFPIQKDLHLLAVARYILKNPVRAALVERAGGWEWSSYAAHVGTEAHVRVDPLPTGWPRDWTSWVDAAVTACEVERIRVSVNKGTPFGSGGWTSETASRLGLESTLRPRGRPSRRGENENVPFFGGRGGNG